MATKNVNSIAASSELAGEDGMAMVGAALKRFTARSQLLVVDAFKGIDPRELTRIEAASRMVEPRNGAQVFAEVDAPNSVCAVVGGAHH